MENQAMNPFDAASVVAVNTGISVMGNMDKPNVLALRDYTLGEDQIAAVRAQCEALGFALETK